MTSCSGLHPDTSAREDQRKYTRTSSLREFDRARVAGGPASVCHPARGRPGGQVAQGSLEPHAGSAPQTHERRRADLASESTFTPREDSSRNVAVNSEPETCAVLCQSRRRGWPAYRAPGVWVWARLDPAVRGKLTTVELSTQVNPSSISLISLPLSVRSLPRQPTTFTMAATTTSNERTPLLAAPKAAENRDPATVSLHRGSGGRDEHEPITDLIAIGRVQMSIRTRNLILGSVWMVSVDQYQS